MDELFALVYFLIILNMFVVLFMGYKECSNQNTNFKVEFPLNNSSLHKDEGEMNLETDNIFTRRS